MHVHVQVCHFGSVLTICVPGVRGSLSVRVSEWRVESGEWRVESGEWRVESGEWRVERGEWRGGCDFFLSRVYTMLYCMLTCFT